MTDQTNDKWAFDPQTGRLGVGGGVRARMQVRKTNRKKTVTITFSDWTSEQLRELADDLPAYISDRIIAGIEVADFDPNQISIMDFIEGEE